jgi:hypothetical protein
MDTLLLEHDDLFLDDAAQGIVGFERSLAREGQLDTRNNRDWGGGMIIWAFRR